MRASWTPIGLALVLWTGVSVASAPQRTAPGPRTPDTAPVALFQTADECLACHNGITTASGEDISFGASWRASMMANASRDPYWQAAVRRETIDHPEHAGDIEQECIICHMPMAHTQALAAGQRARVFANVPAGGAAGGAAGLAADGVSCALCHQIQPAHYGMRDAFNGGFVIDMKAPAETRAIFGPYPVDEGRRRLMRSATGFIPAEAQHLSGAGVCAPCHTLYTKALGKDGKVIGELPEQVPFLEWRHSAYHMERTCQDCHMPVIDEAVPITSVVGVARRDVNRHTFRGGNSFMIGLLNRQRQPLAVVASSQELSTAARETVRFMRGEAASISVENAHVAGGTLAFDVEVRNRSGHKFPTAYPSRRAWLHVVVKDAGGRVVFESGRINPDGSIEGNDNDGDGTRFEPHHRVIEASSAVQVYESVMVDEHGTVTTGLLSGVRYVKDNRLLPRGFDKGRAHPDIAVQGDAKSDDDFRDGSDRVRYAVKLAGGGGPATVEVALRFQSIGFRWAQSLGRYDAAEPRRFVGYYTAAAAQSSEVIARATTAVR